MLVLETDGLTKLYPGGGGCHDISLKVAAGETFGLLGPNGAGKSTFIKTLVGLLYPTAGSASLLGRPLGDLEARKEIGFLPENFRYHDWMTAAELLEFHGLLSGMTRNRVRRRIPEVLALVGLEDAGKKLVRSFSKGMQQRLGLAVALLAGPRLLFMDEPTSALDPIGRVEIREIIQHLQEEGVTVFLNSHLLTEVEKVCRRVAIIREGRVVAEGELEKLLSGGTGAEIEAAGLTAPLIAQLSGLGEISGRERLEGDREKIMLRLNDSEALPQAAALLVSGGAKIYHLARRRNTLEQLFVELMEGDDSHV